LAIYRGAGGAGDAVGDASSEVLLALAAKDAAIAAEVAAETAQAAAQTSATNAATSATNASNSASTASTQASNAASSASAASTSASNASTSATNASNSASAASTSATNASNSASAASTSATNASNSASAASTSASNASTSASNAATSATNAANAQTAAETARDQTLTAYDNFDDRYLGAKTSDPSVDNDGNALVAGALYFNSSLGSMKVYTGSVWVDAYSSGTSFLAKANNLSDLTNTATARTNLGVAIGTNVQAYDADLATIAGLTPTNNYAIIGNGTSWTSSALPASGVTSVTGTSPISSSGGSTPAISLDNSGVTANTYGSSTAIPVITVTAKGLITSVTTSSVSSLPSQTGNSGKYLTTDGSTASWATLATGNTTANGLWENSNTISSNYTITTNYNAMSVGDLTVANGVTVTVPSGSTWIIL
jgi:hypothetical protein